MDRYWENVWDDSMDSTLEPKTEVRKKKISNLQSIMEKNDTSFRKLVRKLKFWV